MLFKPPYHAMFDVDTPLYPSDFTQPSQWFGDLKMTPERTMVYYALQRYVRAGVFTEPGRYLLRMRRKGLRIRGNIFKFPPDAPTERIVAFLGVIGIVIEGEVRNESRGDTGPRDHEDPPGGPGSGPSAYTSYGHPN